MHAMRYLGDVAGFAYYLELTPGFSVGRLVFFWRVAMVRANFRGLVIEEWFIKNFAVRRNALVFMERDETAYRFWRTLAHWRNGEQTTEDVL